MIDYEVLEAYLNIQNKINLVLRDKANLVREYHQTPVIHSVWNWDASGQKFSYTKPENIVIAFVDTCAAYDKFLTSLFYRQKMFTDYLSQLNKDDRHRLGTGSDPQLDLKVSNFLLKLEKKVRSMYRFQKED